MTRAGAWIEGMRLRTLPVSAAGVIAAVGGVAATGRPIAWGWAAICLVFALLAQIASNFANEYFDYRSGVDTAAGRRGPQRGVANGLISPGAMLTATVITLALACGVGLLTVMRGGWWLVACGAFIAVGVLAYSAGPWPLSRHCMGEVAVVLFYGIVPVTLTDYLLTLTFSPRALLLGLAVGLWGAMVILLNNYRDIDSDRAAGKRTLSTVVGRGGSALLYCGLGQFAGLGLWLAGGMGWGFLPLIPMGLGFGVSYLLHNRELTGEQCTRLLAITSILLLLTVTVHLIIALCI